MKDKKHIPYYVSMPVVFILCSLFILLLITGVLLSLYDKDNIVLSRVCYFCSFISGVLCPIVNSVYRIRKQEIEHQKELQEQQERQRQIELKQQVELIKQMELRKREELPKQKARQLWNLEDAKECAICVSAHQWKQVLADGRERKRSSVSEGQIIALPHVLSSLHKAYGDSFPWTNLYNSHTPQAAAAFANDNDLILIGGSVTNPQTGAVFHLVRNRVDIRYTHEWLQVVVHHGQDRGTYRYDIERKGTIDDGIFEVTKDYAIILHVTVRGAVRNRKIVVLAGCTTLGTGGAGQFFCSRMIDNKHWQTMGDRDYVAILSCPYVNQRPDMENTRVEEFINI
ncbi:MAG: hypothetical protein E7034_08780 [Akkermansiaceae bacterium]|nr:hypothetical protein [Akkermansiaceae bacterium]